MPAVTTWLGTPANEGPIELFPDPASLFDEWSDAHAARIIPLARFDLAVLGEPEVAGIGVFLFYEDVSCSFLNWSMRDGKIVELDPSWRGLRPLRERPTRDALARSAGGTHMRLDKFTVDVPLVSAIGNVEWVTQFEHALTAAGASSPLLRLRLGGHPCYVQAAGHVDDDVWVLAELPTSALDLDPKYLYLFGDGATLAQEMQMT